MHWLPRIRLQRSLPTGGLQGPTSGVGLWLVRLFGLIAMLSAVAAKASAMETVTFERKGQTHTVRGQVQLEDPTGSVIFNTREDRLLLIMADEIVHRETDQVPFSRLPDEEYQRAVLASLPPGFQVHRTNRYLVFHDTSRSYTLWCAGLFERLYLAFTNYWKQRGFRVETPDHRLTAIVFARKADYIRYSRPVLGDAADAVIAYYNMNTNHLVMYDLTGREAAGVGARRYSSDEINRILSSRGAGGTVATIVHEATHQIAYNCGLHQRLSYCPRWCSEGIAMYFETPDLSSSRGWSGIDLVNGNRLSRMRRYLGRRPGDSLRTLIASDERFLDTSTAEDAYAEAWSLTYFLLHRYPKQYQAYVKAMAAKRPGVPDTPEERWQEFVEAIGVAPARLDHEFIRYVIQLR